MPKNIDYSKSSKSLLLGVIFVLIIIAAYFGWTASQKQTEVQNLLSTEQNAIDEIKNSNPKNSPETLIVQESTKVEPPKINFKPGQKKYSSNNLNIEFSYLETDVEQQITEKTLVKELGNRIYLYDERGGVTNGQYIEIFSKDADKSFEETLIETFIVTGENKENCEITDERTYIDTGVDYPDTFEFLNIKVKGEFESFAEVFPLLEKCPSPYTMSNGISYFVYDKNFPDKYAFVSIGQYAIMADDDYTWQDTIRFTK